MGRMKITLILFLAFHMFSTGVSADEGTYSPAYMTSPSASVAEKPASTPKPTPTPSIQANQSQPEITCTLRITLPADTGAPMQARLTASGLIDHKPVPVFRYVFGDGESATGSGELVHVYSQPGTYQVRVTPEVMGVVDTPICKSAITVTGNQNTPTPTPQPTSVTTSSTEISSSAGTVTTQPKTGPSTWYWVSLLCLSIVWLGALRWYQRQHPQIG